MRAAAARCERVTVQVLASSVESIPLDVRAAWVREEHPDVRVVAAMDDAEVDFDSPAAWDAHMPLIRDLLDEPVDAVLTSDPYGEELARRLDASWVQVDPGTGRHTGVGDRGARRRRRPLVGAAVPGAGLVRPARRGGRRRVDRHHDAVARARGPPRHRLGAGVRPGVERDPPRRAGRAVAHRRVRPRRARAGATGGRRGADGTAPGAGVRHRRARHHGLARALRRVGVGVGDGAGEAAGARPVPADGRRDPVRAGRHARRRAPARRG